MTGTDYIDLAGVAELAGIGVDSARTYHTRAEANRKNGTPRPGDLPPPDITLAGRPGWRPATIEAWIANRPGRGGPGLSRTRRGS